MAYAYATTGTAGKGELREEDRAMDDLAHEEAWREMEAESDDPAAEGFRWF
jgi:hypothetical protein